MKRAFLITVMLVSAIVVGSAQQQRPSLTKTADKVTTLEVVTTDHDTRLSQLEAVAAAQSAKIDSLDNEPAATVGTGGESGFKIPTNAEEALAMLALIMSALGWLFTGAIAKKLPPWLTKFSLSLIVAVVLSGLGLAFSKGQFGFGEMVLLFGAILGFSNAAHQTTKPAKPA